MAGLAPDMLVSDLVMAGMDGLALVCAARRTRPGLPALLVTGHAGDVTPAPLAAAAGGRPLRSAAQASIAGGSVGAGLVVVEAGRSAPPAAPRVGARETVRRGLKVLVSPLTHAHSAA
jgi:CheY-like chemotaxis protein